ncbi:endonuclease III [Sandaracinobacteroides sp. A072]|uniref:endonuclease III n=1 Tax=Sandaracinobacteroides sp. A072 TaxID=3461146 RepID=UPI0040437989
MARTPSDKKPPVRAAKARPLSPAEVEAIFDALGAANPDPRTELDYVNPYTLLVAVVLSAQATDAGVNRATKALFQTVQTPQAMLDLGLEGLRQHIRTIGLFNAKAANVIRLSEQLIERHGGAVPRTRAELEALAGVGRKTANVVLNEAFGEPTLAVDTHVFRVARRIGLCDGKTPEAVERQLVPQVPARWARPAHHMLILHGRYLCKARQPECWRCPVASWCRHMPKTPEPRKGSRKPAA